MPTVVFDTFADATDARAWVRRVRVGQQVHFCHNDRGDTSLYSGARYEYTGDGNWGYRDENNVLRTDFDTSNDLMIFWLIAANGNRPVIFPEPAPPIIQSLDAYVG